MGYGTATGPESVRAVGGGDWARRRQDCDYPQYFLLAATAHRLRGLLDHGGPLGGLPPVGPGCGRWSWRGRPCPSPSPIRRGRSSSPSRRPPRNCGSPNASTKAHRHRRLEGREAPRAYPSNQIGREPAAGAHRLRSSRRRPSAVERMPPQRALYCRRVRGSCAPSSTTPAAALRSGGRPRLAPSR